MPTPTVKKEYKINVSKLVYALLISDTKDACTYGSVKEFASARNKPLKA